MHAFMDARDVRPAWELMQRGEVSDDPKIRATQERLEACSYAMAHPETGTLVPACAQHSVLDPLENERLQELLPAIRSAGPPAPVAAVHSPGPTGERACISFQQAPPIASGRRDRRVAGRRPSAALATSPCATATAPGARRRCYSRLLRTAVARRPARGSCSATSCSPPEARPPIRRVLVNTLNDEFEAQVVDLAGQTISDSTPRRRSDGPRLRRRQHGDRGHEPHRSPAQGLLRDVHRLAGERPHARNVNSKYELYSDRRTRSTSTAPTARRRRSTASRGPACAGATGRAQQGLTMDIEADCVMVAKAVDEPRQRLSQAGRRSPRRYPRSGASSDRARDGEVVRSDDYRPPSRAGALAREDGVRGRERQAKKAFETQLSQGPTPDAESSPRSPPATWLDPAGHGGAGGAGARAQHPCPRERRRGVRELCVSTGQTPTRHDVHGRSTAIFWAQHIGAVVAASGRQRVHARELRPPTEIVAIASTATPSRCTAQGERSWQEAWTRRRRGRARRAPARGPGRAPAVVKSQRGVGPEAPDVALGVADGEVARAVVGVGQLHDDLGARRDRAVVQRVDVVGRARRASRGRRACPSGRAASGSELSMTMPPPGRLSSAWAIASPSPAWTSFSVKPNASPSQSIAARASW